MTFKAGASKAVITPPVGFNLAGYGERSQGCIGVHDDLYAKSLVLDDGNETVAVVSCDLSSIANEIVNDVRAKVHTAIGLKPDNILIAAIHTHSGPASTGWGSTRDEQYVDTLIAQIVLSITEAYNNLAEATIGSGRGVADIGSNRRNPDYPPERRYWCYPYPEGTGDSSVGVVKIDNLQGDTIASIINASCHCVVLGCTNLLVSADFAGYATGLVEKSIGGIALFLNGCCGNINPHNTDGSYTIIDGHALSGDDLFREAERVGTILGNEALKVLEKIETGNSVTLKAARREITLPVRKDMPEKPLGRLKSVKPDSPYYDRFGAVLKGENLRTEIQALSIGNMAFLGLPGEIFAEFGIQIKNNSAFENTIISELTNDTIGYVPTAQAFDEGGYEPTSSLLTPDGGERLAAYAEELLAALHD